MRRRTSAFAIAALAALAVTAPQASAAPTATASASVQCPATFRVLHNDRIGPAVLPQGIYVITVQQPGLACATASNLFTQFLIDYDGRLSKGWTVVAQSSGRARFLQNGGPGFSVARQSGGGGGGGGGNVPSTYGFVCPGNFQVLNNDTIGPLQFPKGSYRIVIPRGSIVTCPQAINLFRQFLNRPAGNLPKNWRMKASIALFFKPGNSQRKKFRVDPAT